VTKLISRPFSPNSSSLASYRGGLTAHLVKEVEQPSRAFYATTLLTCPSLWTRPGTTPSADFGYLQRGQTFQWDGRTRDPRCGADDCSVATYLLGTGDLTGDGRPDLIYGSHYQDGTGRHFDESSPLIIYSAGADGKFEVLPVQTKETDGVRREHMRSIEINDFNGDGVNDLFVAAHGYDFRPFDGEQNVLLLSSPEGLRDVSFDNLPAQNDFAHGADSGDLDSDGDNDIVVITNAGSEEIEHYVLWNDGTGNFTKAGLATILDHELAVYMERGVASWSKYVNVKIDDFDGDSHLDLLLCVSGDDADRRSAYSGMTLTRIAYGDGSGRWTKANTLELPVDRWGPATITADSAVFDMDNDGDKDLVLSLAHSIDPKNPWAGSFYQVLRNDGERRFTDTTATSLFPQGTDKAQAFLGLFLTVADLNLDGAGDLVVTGGDPWRFPATEAARRTVRLMIGDGRGHFARANPLQWRGQIYEGQFLGAGDFDGDGDTDVAGMWGDGRGSPNDYMFSGFTATIFENQGKPVFPALPPNIDMAVSGATSTRQRFSLYDGDSTEVNTTLFTEILSGEMPAGLGSFAFNILGNYYGSFSTVLIVVADPQMTKGDADRVLNCGVPKTVEHWDDGTYHLAIPLIPMPNGLAPNSGSIGCLLDAAPKESSAVARYVIDNLGAIASDMVNLGEVDLVTNSNLKQWLMDLADGNVLVAGVPQ
jgi:hypothetical protein